VAAIDRLLAEYDRFVRLPWSRPVAGPERVWFAEYPPQEERRLRRCLAEFALATRRAGHAWADCDLTRAFTEWMAAEEYRDAYFAAPRDIEPALADFRAHAADRVINTLERDNVDDSTVVGVHGVASLFGFVKVHQLVEAVQPRIRGRLLLFFPGSHEGTTGYFLDETDGWNYLAVWIGDT